MTESPAKSESPKRESPKSAPPKPIEPEPAGQHDQSSQPPIEVDSQVRENNPIRSLSIVISNAS